MPNRRRPPWYKIEALEREPRDPLVWLGQYAAADRRGDGRVAEELHRQLVSLGYAIVQSEVLPVGTLLATLAVTQGTTYRLVRLETQEIGRLMRETGAHLGRSTP